jgi:hypothetical protein
MAPGGENEEAKALVTAMEAPADASPMRIGCSR